MSDSTVLSAIVTVVSAFFFSLSRLNSSLNKRSELSQAKKKTSVEERIAAANELDYGGPHASFENQPARKGHIVIQTEDTRFEAPHNFDGEVTIETSLTRIKCQCVAGKPSAIHTTGKANSTDTSVGGKPELERLPEVAMSVAPQSHVERLHMFARTTGSIATILQFGHWFMQQLAYVLDLIFPRGGGWQL